MQVTLWDAAEDGSRGDFVRRIWLSSSDQTFTELVAAGCHWLVFEAPDGASFEGSQTKEIFTCVEAFDEVTGLDVLVSDAEGNAYVRASLGDTPQIIEPDDEPIFVPVPVILDRTWDQPVSAFYAVTSNGSDGFPDEEQAIRELIFAPGEIEKVIQLKVYGDTFYRPEPGRVEVDFSELRASGSLSWYRGAWLTVVENDPRSPLSVVVNDEAAYEENSDQGDGRGIWQFTVRLKHDNRELEGGCSCLVVKRQSGVLGGGLVRRGLRFGASRG